MNTLQIKEALANNPTTGIEEALNYYKDLADDEGKAYCINELNKIDQHREAEIKAERELRNAYMKNQYNKLNK